MDTEYLEQIVGGSRRKMSHKKMSAGSRKKTTHKKKTGGRKVVKPMGVLTKTKLKSHITKVLKGHGVHHHVLKHLNGMGFFDKLWSGLKEVGSKVVGLAKEAIPHVKSALPYVRRIKGLEKYADKAEKALNHPVAKALGFGKHKTRKSGCARSAGSRSGGASKRGEIVRKVMKKNGLTLPEASKYVKEHGLY